MNANLALLFGLNPDKPVKFESVNSAKVIRGYESSMAEYGWTWDELMGTPIPAYILMLSARQERYKPMKPKKPRGK